MIIMAKIPKEVIDEIKLSEARPIAAEIRSIFDGNQHSIKRPARVASALGLKGPARFELSFKEPDTLILNLKKVG